MKQTTVLEVQERHSKKVWVITRCDADPETHGLVTGCGVPYPAKDVPVGTTFTSVLSIPEEQ